MARHVPQTGSRSGGRAGLVRYTGLSERAVGTCLDRLAAEGTIAPCDRRRRRGTDKPRRPPPAGLGLDLSLVRDGLDSAAFAVLDRQVPRLAVSLAAAA